MFIETALLQNSGCSTSFDFPLETIGFAQSSIPASISPCGSRMVGEFGSGQNSGDKSTIEA
jgi:hypothetical protein